VAITIGSNIPSLRAQRQLVQNQDQLGSIRERLSSGSRINRASDDAAGLSISSALQADSRIFSKAIRNLNDGISVLNISEGTLQQLNEVTVRQRELAEQSANGVYTNRQRIAMNNESKALTNEFNRVLAITKFNGQGLLDLSNTTTHLQGGYGTENILSLNLGGQLARNVGTGSFANQVTSAVTNAAGSVATADFNGDGYLDIVSSAGAFAIGSNLDLLIGSATGTFTSGGVIAGGATSRQEVFAADFNGDGRMDLLSTKSNSTIDIFLGNGNGTFASAANYSASAAITSAGVADLNNDGFADVMLAHHATGTYEIFMSQGASGTLNAGQSTANGSSVQTVEAGDYDQDGVLDIVAINATTNIGTVLLGNGNGTFRVGSTFNNTGQSYNSSAGDFDGDGILDIASVNGTSTFVAFGNANGTFANSITVAGGTAPSSVQAADFNSDGRVDLMVTNYQAGTGHATLLLANADRTFAVASSSNVNQNILAGAAGDFNNDGALDFVAVSETVAGVLMQNTTRSTSIAHYDIRTQSLARTALDALATQQRRVNAEIGQVGVFQSRIATAVNVLAASQETYLAAASRIQDADIASDVSQQIRLQILGQFSASILAQANQGPELALRLLSN
jgi:flagellin-like hook-associated protein FlgL